MKAWCQFDSFMTSLYLVSELNKRMKDEEEEVSYVVEPKTSVPLFNRSAIFWFYTRVLYVFECHQPHQAL